MALELTVLGLMLVYLDAGTGLRIALIGIVLLIWIAFFAFCEGEFKRARQRLVVPAKAIC